MAGVDAHPAVRAFRRVPSDRAGIFCDFDGTLSSIVAVPDEAKPARGAARALTGLAERFAVVAVVSGRPARDLASRLKAPGVRLVGLHGLEELQGTTVRVAPEAERFRAAAERMAAELKSELRGLTGVVVEGKGLALAVHFRRASDPDAAERRARPAVEAAARREGFVLAEGRRVLELRPPAGGDKGDAVARIIAETGLTAALAAGDDVGDLPMFESVRHSDCSVVVAVASTEAPAVAATADIIVGSPSELVSLFRALSRD